MGGFPLSRNFTCVYTHVIFNHVNKVEARYERGSTFTLTCDLSFIASFLFANVNCIYVRTQTLRDSGNPPYGRPRVNAVI